MCPCCYWCWSVSVTCLVQVDSVEECNACLLYTSNLGLLPHSWTEPKIIWMVLFIAPNQMFKILIPAKKCTSFSFIYFCNRKGVLDDFILSWLILWDTENIQGSTENKRNGSLTYGVCRLHKMLVHGVHCLTVTSWMCWAICCIDHTSCPVVSSPVETFG